MSLWKGWRHGNVISLLKFFSNSGPKWAVIVAFFNSSCVVWTKNIGCISKWNFRFWVSSSAVSEGPRYQRTTHHSREHSLRCWLVNPLSQTWLHQDWARTVKVCVAFEWHLSISSSVIQRSLVKILHIFWPKKEYHRHLASVPPYFLAHCVEERL